MENLNLIVIAPPNARYLALLEKLPPSTRITVGRTPEAFETAAADADVVFNGMNVGDTLKRIWKDLGKVKWIHSLSAGLDATLFPELAESPVPLTNSRGVFKRSLAEFAIGGMLFFAKDFRRMLKNQAAARWEQFDVEELHGRTLGVFGYGEIGRATAEKAHALGMKVIATRRRPELSKNDPIVDKFYSIDQRLELIAASDYVVAAAPLTPETKAILSDREFAAMKPTGVFINVGRGPVVDEAALIRVLQAGKIRGAALDVFEVEPLPESSPLWRLENVLLSPHCADHTSTWLEEAMQFFVDNFERFADGRPLENVTDKRAGY
jgi:phosphoglycerate dehydrogenase-like enzyme